MNFCNAILEQFNKEYDFLYENYDKVAGYNDALDFYENHIEKSETLRDMMCWLSKARQDLFLSDREIVALMFAFEHFGMLELFEEKGCIIES